jgi:putative transposase
VSGKRVKRPMRRAGLSGWCASSAAARRSGCPASGSPTTSSIAPNVLWFADITYLRTWEAWVYLAAVQDAFSRRIVGWSMADHLRAELVIDALEMAVARRRAAPGLIRHSDQGSQYVSLGFGQEARDAGIAVSMGPKGDCYDNAVAESVFATLQTELVHCRS